MYLATWLLILGITSKWIWPGNATITGQPTAQQERQNNNDHTTARTRYKPSNQLFLPCIMIAKLEKNTEHCTTKQGSNTKLTGLRRAVSNVSGNRFESDCRSRGHEFDPGPVPYFRGDWLWNNFYGHCTPFCWIIQEGLLLVQAKVCALSTG